MEKKKAKKPRKSRIPRTRNAGTLTEAQFWGGIRAALRNKSRWWKPVSVARRKARRPYSGPIKRRKWEYQCSRCLKWFPLDKTEVHHKISVGTLKCAEDLPEFVERLFVEEEGLCVLCEKCHKEITKNEKK